MPTKLTKLTRLTTLTDIRLRFQREVATWKHLSYEDSQKGIDAFVVEVLDYLNDTPASEHILVKNVFLQGLSYVRATAKVSETAYHTDMYIDATKETDIILRLLKALETFYGIFKVEHKSVLSQNAHTSFGTPAVTFYPDSIVLTY